MTDEQRPVEVVYDVATHTRTDTPLTDAQWADHKQREADTERENAARLAQEKADHDLIRQEAQTSPAFAALARKMGVSL